MKIIYKYVLQPGITEIDVESDSKVLHVDCQGGDQGGDACAWILLDPEKEKTHKMQLLSVMTGELSDKICYDNYIGSVTGVEGWMVVHVFRLS